MGAPKKELVIFQELADSSMENYNYYKENAEQPLMKAMIYYIDNISDNCDKNLMIALMFGCDGKMNTLASRLDVSVGKIYDRLSILKANAIEYSIKNSEKFDL